MQAATQFDAVGLYAVLYVESSGGIVMVQGRITGVVDWTLVVVPTGVLW